MAVYAGDYEEMIAIGSSAADHSPRADIDRYTAAALGAYAATSPGTRPAARSSRTRHSNWPGALTIPCA